MNGFQPTGQGQSLSFAPTSIVEVAATPAVELTKEEKTAAIGNWIIDRNAARDAVEREMLSRNEMVTTLFPNAKKGTQRYIDPDGAGAIKLVYGYTYSMGDSELLDDNGVKISIRDQVEAVLDIIDKEFGVEGEQLTQRLVKWKPELSPTEYLALDVTFAVQARAKELIDAILTVKPASPQITVEPPKTPK